MASAIRFHSTSLHSIFTHEGRTKTLLTPHRTTLRLLSRRTSRAGEPGFLTGSYRAEARSVEMAKQVGRLAYTLVYVKDVAKSIDFYEKAFGISIRRVDQGEKWAEMESGSTTLAFTPIEQRETEITGGVQQTDLGSPRPNVELALGFKDVDAAFKQAVAEGAVPVSPPEQKPWGQKVGYVRDIDGVMIRIGSEL